MILQIDVACCYFLSAIANSCHAARHLADPNGGIALMKWKTVRFVVHFVVRLYLLYCSLVSAHCSNLISPFSFQVSLKPVKVV